MPRALMALAVAIGTLFWALTATAQGSNYRIQPGDTLSIEVLEDSSLNRRALVTPDGRFSFPLAGTVQAANRTVSQVERALASALAPSFANPPTVFVSVANLGPRDPEAPMDETDVITVFILGEVAEPGPKQLPAGTTLLQVLSTTGGFTPFAATKRLQLRRRHPETGQERLYVINYRAISRGATISGQTVMLDGDVILVPERRLFE